MKNILIIGGDKQPIPPIKGGAVENLIQMFIDENEILKKININVISVFDKEFDKIENKKKVKYCKYFYVENNSSLEKIKVFATNVFHKIFKRSIIFGKKYIDDVIKVVRKYKINSDIIIVENYIEAIIPLRKEFPNSKIILHLHNDKLNNNIINARKVVDCCSKIITVSDYINKQVTTIPEANNKTYTLINSICISKFGTNENRINAYVLREKYGLTDSDFVILFSGRIAKTKGVLQLLKAFKKIDNSNIKLVIVGNSWYGKESKNDKYLNEINKESNSNANNIIFTGYVDYEDMPDYYCMADVVTIPSIWQEPCSLTLFETMASKIPLITTNTGGTKEVVRENAILLDVDDSFIEKLNEAILYLYNNPKVGRDMSEKAYTYIQQYNPRRYYEELCTIIGEEKL